MLIVYSRLPPLFSFFAFSPIVRYGGHSSQFANDPRLSAGGFARGRSSSWGWSGRRLDSAQTYDNRLNVMRDLLAFGDI